MGILDVLRSTSVKLTASDYPTNAGNYNKGGHETDHPVSGAVRAKNPQKLKYYAWILKNISKFTVDSAAKSSLKGVIGGGSRVLKKGKKGTQDEKPSSASYEYLMEKKLQEEDMNQLEQQSDILSTHANAKKKLKENGFSEEEAIGLTSEPKRLFIRSRL